MLVVFGRLHFVGRLFVRNFVNNVNGGAEFLFSWGDRDGFGSSGDPEVLLHRLGSGESDGCFGDGEDLSDRYAGCRGVEIGSFPSVAHRLVTGLVEKGIWICYRERDAAKLVGSGFNELVKEWSELVEIANANADVITDLVAYDFWTLVRLVAIAVVLGGDSESGCLDIAFFDTGFGEFFHEFFHGSGIGCERRLRG